MGGDVLQLLSKIKVNPGIQWIYSEIHSSGFVMVMYHFFGHVLWRICLFLICFSQSRSGTHKKGDDFSFTLFLNSSLHLADTFIQSDSQYNQVILVFFVSMCVPWEFNSQPFTPLTQCSTTEPTGHRIKYK